jgi:hypothetical protein
MLYVAPYLLVYKKLVLNQLNKVQLFINMPSNYTDRINKFSNKNHESELDFKLKYDYDDIINLIQDYNSNSEKVFSNDDLKAFSNEFKKNLLQLTYYYHENFLKSNRIKHDVHENKTWNSQFILETIKDIPCFNLPKLEEELNSKSLSKVNDLLDTNDITKQLFEYNYRKSLVNSKNKNDNLSLKDEFSILGKNSYLNFLSNDTKLKVRKNYNK